MTTASRSLGIPMLIGSRDDVALAEPFAAGRSPEATT
jgi:hypothetical protein